MRDKKNSYQAFFYFLKLEELAKQSKVSNATKKTLGLLEFPFITEKHFVIRKYAKTYNLDDSF